MAKNTDTTSSTIIDANSSFKQKGDSQTINILNEYIRNQDKVISNLKTKFTSDIKKIKADEIEPLKVSLTEELRELKNRSDRTIETIGIFAALLSFVTFEAQIFKSDLNGFTLLGLSSLLLGALLIFVFALSNAFNPTKQGDINLYLKHPLIALPIFLIIAGITMAWTGYSKDSREQESIKQLNQEINELRFNYHKDDTDIERKINELEIRINQIASEDQSGKLDSFKECIKTQGLARCL